MDREDESNLISGLLRERDLGGRWNLLLIVASATVALAVRFALLPFQTRDLRIHVGWYDFIADNGHFAALQYGFADINVFYLYLLASMTTLATLVPSFPSFVAIKLLSVAFDFVLAYFVYKCVRLKYREARTFPILAAVLTLLWPTVVLNGAMWGQWDSAHVAFMVACLYFLLAGRQAAAFLAFGLAFAAKPQAVFLAPLFLWLLLQKAVDWRYFALVPAVFLVVLVPAWLAGGSIEELLLIYYNLSQRHPWLTAGAPNLYVWIPGRYFSWHPLGVVFTACVVLFLGVAIYRSRAKASAALTVYLGAYSTLVMPYLLPKMHQRYWFAAEIFAIVLLFYMPRYWYVSVVVAATSLCTYTVYLANTSVIDIRVLTVVLLALIALLTRRLQQMLAIPK